MRLSQTIYYLSPVVNAIRMISLTDDLREIAAICSENEEAVERDRDWKIAELKAGSNLL